MDSIIHILKIGLWFLPWPVLIENHDLSSFEIVDQLAAKNILNSSLRVLSHTLNSKTIVRIKENNLSHLKSI